MRIIPFLIVCLSFPIISEELQKGNPFPIEELPDQYETIREIPKDTRKIFFLSDMSASKILHSVMESKNQDYLEERKALIVSDIHKMPGLITKFVALPKMQSYTYRLHLIRDDEKGALLPKEKNAITYFKLKKGKIQEIRFLYSAEELEKALEEK